MKFLPRRRVEGMSAELGISFKVKPETEAQLRKAGATDALITALRRLAPHPVPPESAPSKPTPTVRDALIEEQLAHGKALLDQQKWDEAIAEFNKAIRLQPKSA